MPESISIEQIIRLGSSAGAVIIVLALLFRKQVGVWLTSRSFDRQVLVRDVAAIRDDFARHTAKEEDYWTEYDAKLGEVSARTSKLELTNVELRVSLERDHEETIRGLRDTNESIKELTRALMDHIQRGAA
jgi:hypothetical protein